MILFVQTAFLGDLLLSVPTLIALRHEFPEKKIHLLCRKGLGSVLLHLGLVDVVFDQFSGTKPTVREWKKIALYRDYDYVICPHESLRSKLLCWFTKGQKKIGFRSFLGKFVFNTTENRPMYFPEPLRQLFLVRSLIPSINEHLEELPKHFQVFSKIPEWSSMRLVPDVLKVGHRKKWCEKMLLDPNKKIICLAPGSVWATKRWNLESFAETAADHLKKGHQVLIIGSREEAFLGEVIGAQVPEVMNLCGKTNLIELTEILAASDLLVSNDSGSMHLAAVAGTPVVTVFGPTVLEFGYQPWMNEFRVVEEKNLSCRPCSSHGGQKCPIETHECMKMIRSDRVISASETLLAIK
jgi:heptosyltransferase II